MRRHTTALVIVILAAGAIATALGVRASRPATEHQTDSAAHATSNQRTVTPRAEVTLDTRRQQLIGVRTVMAQHAVLAPEVRAAGTVTYDETRQAEINTRVDGWIRELYADYTGRTIRRGEPLFTLYSPDLIANQNEYLLALRGRSHAGHDPQASVSAYEERLIDAARDRLLRLDMTADDIDQLRDSGRPAETLTFRSPVDGVIVDKPAVRGMRVMAGQTLFRVADLSTVWVEADVYERDLTAVRKGTAAVVTVQAYADKSFTGRVSYISPIVSPDTRTVRTRISLSNPNGLLKPNMVATVTLRAPESMALVVPPDAVVETGEQRIVFVAESNGRFTPREVHVGRRTPDAVEILSGLTHGEEVAASATFFLDSESQLRSALQTYQAPAPGAQAATQAAQAVDVVFRSEPDPPKAGDATLVVTAKDSRGAPVTGAQVSVVLFMPPMPTMNMPAARSEATLLHTSDGVYRGTAELMSAGRWDVTVTVTKDGRTIASRQFALMVR